MAFPRAEHMRIALRLAALGLGRTSPNPAVGAVVVRGSAVVGRGYHRAAGMPHAEVEALRDAGPAARGADLYVSLEPCDHHGRTGPCTEAILAAGIRRVAAAMEDPNPRVSGKGFARLRKAGIEVSAGLLSAEARDLNAGYCRWITTGRPFVTLKLALSLDGRIAASTGDSRWVSGEKSRAMVHRMRSRVDAVLVGAGTARADDPLLSSRVRRGRDPRRILLTSSLEGLERLRIFREGDGEVIVACPETPGRTRAIRLEALGARILRIPAHGGLIRSRDLLERLGKEGITSLLVEGGGATAGMFASEGSVDRYVFFYGPLLLGEGVGAVSGFRPGVIGDAIPLRISGVRRVGTDIMVVAEADGRERRIDRRGRKGATSG